MYLNSSFPVLLDFENKCSSITFLCSVYVLSIITQTPCVMVQAPYIVRLPKINFILRSSCPKPSFSLQLY
ncbi:hypothetical protein QVD17_31544 [Tagetes erecta]|uniref:Uncharacterized protein n=1 Tax=Tagetes erecta TaxID=13708 RepID=A0AAD8NPE9_TARER|nr:hypothetical protein QVD17_31544 [Tagetes erecta]